MVERGWDEAIRSVHKEAGGRGGSGQETSETSNQERLNENLFFLLVKQLS